MVVHAPHEEASKTQQLFNTAKKIKVHIEDHTIKLPKQLAGREPRILRLQLCVEPGSHEATYSPQGTGQTYLLGSLRAGVESHVEQR